MANQLKGDGAQALPRPKDAEKAVEALAQWAQKDTVLAAQLAGYVALSQSFTQQLLTGPTGERNSYTLLPREHVLCLAEDRADLLAQLAAVLAVGSRALVAESNAAVVKELPKEVAQRIELVADWSSTDKVFDAILHHGDSDQLRAVCELASQRKGAIVGVTGLNRGETDIPLERLLIERALSVNTAAAGGNASLMTIG